MLPAYGVYLRAPRQESPAGTGSGAGWRTVHALTVPGARAPRRAERVAVLDGDLGTAAPTVHATSVSPHGRIRSERALVAQPRAGLLRQVPVAVDRCVRRGTPPTATWRIHPNLRLPIRQPGRHVGSEARGRARAAFVEQPTRFPRSGRAGRRKVVPVEPLTVDDERDASALKCDGRGDEWDRRTRATDGLLLLP